jgi:predicted acetyltransferase
MMNDYLSDSKLFERVINTVNEVFPGSKNFALQGIQYKAAWDKTSIPFIIEEHGEIIAHAGVIPLTLMMNGNKHQGAAIHGVCVKKEHRGKGYFKQLMKEAMQYIDTHFESSFLVTDKPYLYKNYPYKTMLPEYDFVVNDEIKLKVKAPDLRMLDLNNPQDLTLVHLLLDTRIPLSNQFSIINKNASTLFILNAMHRNIAYSDKLNAIIIYEVENETLYLKEIVAHSQCSFISIIESIPETFKKIVLQFCPDNLLEKNDYKAVMAKLEGCIMVSTGFTFEGDFFRYPELYLC